MSGMNYYREVYQNIKCKELFYMLSDIVNDKKCEWACNYATMFLQQWIWDNVTNVKSGITGILSRQRMHKLTMFCLSIIFDQIYNYINFTYNQKDLC